MSIITNEANINNDSEKLTSLTRTQQRLTNFASYQAGWDLGRGEAIAPQAIIFARDILDEAYNLGMWRSNAFAHLDSSVMLTFTMHDHDVEIDVAEDGYLALRHELNDEIMIDKTELSRLELSELLQKIAPAYLGNQGSK